MSQEINQTHAFRLKQGEDLKTGIEKIVELNNVSAGWVASCVGSLTSYNIRFANQSTGSNGTGYFEILGLSGTVSINGSHLHICISDSTGKTIGGHLLSGCKIYTTAEIILQSTTKYVFTRENDEDTGWKELVIRDA